MILTALRLTDYVGKGPKRTSNVTTAMGLVSSLYSESLRSVLTAKIEEFHFSNMKTN